MANVFYLFRDAPQRRAALELEPGCAARYLLSGMDQLARARPRGRAQPRAIGAGAVGADRGRRTEARPRARRRVRRRLRDGALVARAAESCGRRVLDGRHGWHPAHAAGARPCRALAVRVRRDRPARAARAAPLEAHGAALRAGARLGGRDRRVQPPRGGPDRRLAARAGRRRPRRVRALRRRRRRVPAGERAARGRRRLDRGGSAPRLRVAARGRADAARRRASSSSRRPSGHARSPRGRRTSPSRPTCPSTRCAAGSSVRAWSLCRYATTATRVRRPCSSRRWRSRSRSSSPETAAIATGYGLEHGRNVLLAAPGDERAFGLARRRSCSTTSREQERSDRGRGRPRRRRSRGSATSIGSKRSSQRRAGAAPG